MTIRRFLALLVSLSLWTAVSMTAMAIAAAPPPGPLQDCVQVKGASCPPTALPQGAALTCAQLEKEAAAVSAQLKNPPNAAVKARLTELLSQINAELKSCSASPTPRLSAAACAALAKDAAEVVAQLKTVPGHEEQAAFTDLLAKIAAIQKAGNCPR
jgi:hypothetical protein